MDRDLSGWRALGARAIRPDRPAGDPARYDPLFERLQAEVNKLEALFGGTVDWKEVVTLGEKIIAEKSKDLLAAGYLCVGLIEEEGYPGLLGGLSCIEGMVETFWDRLYPEETRKRARVNAIVWLSEKGGAAISRKQGMPAAGGLGTGAATRKTVVACAEKIEAIERLFAARLGMDSPGLGDLRRAVEAALMAQKQDRPPEEIASPEPGTGTTTRLIEGAGFDSIASPEGAEQAFREGERLLRRAAAFVRERDPSDPWPYRFARALVWGRIETLPPHVDKVTKIPPPPFHLSERLGFLAGKKGEKNTLMELLNQVETVFQEHPYWLDLQRLSVEALADLGPDYEGVRKGVIGEVRTLLRRLPEWPECRFSDETPFADDRTRAWIAAEGFLSEVSVSPSPKLQSEGEKGGEESVEAIGKKAFLLLAERGLQEALGFFQERIETSRSQRERFLLKWESAKLSLQADEVRLAHAQLEDLDRETRELSLEVWEPALGLELLRSRYLVLARLLQIPLSKKEVALEWARQSEEVYRRISRIDPTAVLEIDQKRK